MCVIKMRLFGDAFFWGLSAVTSLQQQFRLLRGTAPNRSSRGQALHIRQPLNA